MLSKAVQRIVPHQPPESSAAAARLQLSQALNFEAAKGMCNFKVQLLTLAPILEGHVDEYCSMQARQHAAYILGSERRHSVAYAHCVHGGYAGQHNGVFGLCSFQAPRAHVTQHYQ